MINFYYDPILGLTHFSIGITPKTYNYARDKRKLVLFKNGKNSVLLRQFIKEKARNLSSVSQGNYKSIRKIFIEAYNLEGLSAVEAVYNQSIVNILKKSVS